MIEVRRGAVGSVAKLRRDGVCAEERGDDLDRTFVSQALGQGQQAELVGGVEPVPRLDLGRSDAVAEHLAQPSAAVIEKLVI